MNKGIKDLIEKCKKTEYCTYCKYKELCNYARSSIDTAIPPQFWQKRHIYLLEEIITNNER